MRFLEKFFLYLLVGVFSFLLFLYLSFPYQILKEKIVNIISRETSSLVSIKTLNPSFPLGIDVDDLRMYRPGAGELVVDHMTVHVGIFSALFGKIKVSVLLKDPSKGTLDLRVHLSLMDVISQKEMILPSYVSLEADNFDIAPMINYFLSLKASEKDLNPVMKSAFRDMNFVGKLKSNTFFEFDKSDYLDSKGTIDISFVNAGLDVLSLPFQQFQDAHILASLGKGSFTVDPKTSFISDGMKLEVTGNVKQAEDILESKLDLNIKLELYKALKDNFGMLLGFFAPGSEEGTLKVRLKGTLGSPQTDFL